MRPAAPASGIAALPGAVTVPYRISETGRFLLDVSINDAPPRPFSVDTGATISVIYGDHAESSGLRVSQTTLFVRGLISQGARPVIKDVSLGVGSRAFALDQVVVLPTPGIADEAIGLLGGDVFRAQAVLFDKDLSQVTFVPRENLDRRAFAGWKRIPLRNLTDEATNTDLYFAKANLGGVIVPVLFDTGSNLNFINWQLAKMDENIHRLERNMLRNGTLQGALETTSATVETTLFDLNLGRQSWDEVTVVATQLDGLADIAPVDEPMIVAGAKLFAPHTFAFDLEGFNIFIRPDQDP